MNKNIVQKGFVFGLLILFIGLCIFPSTEAMKKEKNFFNTEINGLYYLRDDDPLNRADVGSLLMGISKENELTRCGMFVNFHFAQNGTYTDVNKIFNIYYHVWQKNYAPGLYEIGYSTSSEHAAGFNESIWIDINNYISEVNEYRLVQAVQTTNPNIAKFIGNDINNFTIKVFGPNPCVLCNPNQYSFVILNLEDNNTLQSYDRDNDGLNDFDEIFVFFTNPFDRDTDNDGVSDFIEVNYGIDPNNFNDNFGSNKHPNKPTIKGPSIGKAGIKYNYKFTTTDPEENDVFYYILWGDEQNGKWIGQYGSGEEVTLSHIWDYNGRFTIMAKARDTEGAISEWSSLNVSIPRNSMNNNPLLLKFLEQSPIIKSIMFLIK
jgi:hypothetical protein